MQTFCGFWGLFHRLLGFKTSNSGRSMWSGIFFLFFLFVWTDTKLVSFALNASKQSCRISISFGMSKRFQFALIWRLLNLVKMIIHLSASVQSSIISTFHHQLNGCVLFVIQNWIQFRKIDRRCKTAVGGHILNENSLVKTSNWNVLYFRCPSNLNK